MYIWLNLQIQSSSAEDGRLAIEIHPELNIGYLLVGVIYSVSTNNISYINQKKKRNEKQ